MGNAIDIASVTKSYGELLALAPTSLTIQPGEFLSIVGASGCGKSTLLRLVAGLDKVSTGEVRINDAAITAAYTDVGFVFQSPVLLEWRSVLGNIMLQADARGLDRAETEKKARRLIEAAGLKGFEDVYPHELSGGMSQRVSVCRALVHDPSLLLMDEPFGALDALTRDQMMVDLQSLWLERSPTVIFVTHSIQEAVFLSDRVVVMAPRPGRIEAIIDVPIPRRRRLNVRGSEEFTAIVDRVTGMFERMGIIHEPVDAD